MREISTAAPWLSARRRGVRFKHGGPARDKEKKKK